MLWFGFSNQPGNLGNLIHPLVHSHSKLKKAAVCSLVISFTSSSLPVFTLHSYWLLVLFSIALTSCCDYPGVDLIKGNPKEKQSDTEILTYFNKVHNSATQPSYSIRNCMKRSCDGRDKLWCHCFQRTTAWMTSRKSFFLETWIMVHLLA